MSLLGPNTGGSGYINIRRDVQDAFYRYKMPRLQSKIEGKGNGIKTVVPNMVDIAKALSRPPAYITKFFGAELGALSTCDERAAKYIVNGAHDAERLQGVLDGFISKFVLCQKCDNPETVLTVSKKDGTIYRSCQACGHKGTVDMAHKLVSYIRANPPPKPAKKSQARDRAGAADEMVAKAGRSEEAVIEGMVAPDDFEEAALDEGDAQLGGEDDWAEESAAAARADELASLSENVRNQLSLKTADTNTTSNSATDAKLAALEAFGNWLEGPEGAKASDQEIQAKIRSAGIAAEQALAAIIQVLFAEDWQHAFRSHLELVRSLVTGSREQRALLGSVERLVGVVKPEQLLGKTAVILQALYNADIVEEEALLAWREKPSKKYVSKEVAMQVRKQARPFFEWLETAESDEDDGEDEDEDEDEE